MTIGEMMRDEKGFTTAGMGIALLVSLSLLFSTAQIYRINAVSAEVQDVADAAALAAENQVGEFMVAVRLVDAVTLSLSLLGTASYGLGIVALCVPPVAQLGSQLVSAGDKIVDARNRFADRAATALNEFQQMLPFLAAASAASTAAANGASREVEYRALALLLPAEGEPIELDAAQAELDLGEAVEERKPILEEAAKKAEEAAQAANEAKERAFLRDCGDAPGYCMYERAAQLAGISDADNPLYQSCDAWSFAVALERARNYYRERLLAERPNGETAEERARSALRKRFYAYAIRQLRDAFVEEGSGTFRANFPRFPRNTDQMRGTDLYTEPVYPITQEEGVPMMHAWDGCPNAGLVNSYGSAKTMEEGRFPVCPVCGFSPTALGSVASASTSIDNGFEYHYDAVAQAAEDYEKAVREAAPLTAAAKAEADSLLSKVASAFESIAGRRIEARPPGCHGCIVLVVASGDGGGAFESLFVRANNSLGPRAACSAATLLADKTEGASVIGNLLDGLSPESVVGGAGGLVLDGWAALLDAYADGHDALMNAVESLLNEIPLMSATGLGSWAADSLRDGVAAVGLEPAKTAPLKAVLVSAVAVAREDGGSYAQRFLEAREAALRVSQGSSDVFSALAETVSRQVYDCLEEQKVEIARIDIPLTGISVPLVVALPPSVVEGASGLVEQAFESVRSLVGIPVGLRPWE